MREEKNWAKQPKGEGGGEGGDYNPVWDQSEAPIIEGTLLGSKTNVGKWDKTVYEVKTDDGTVYTVWGTAMLSKQLDPIAINSYIKIQYLGKKQGKTNTYHDYDVFVANEQAPAPAPAPVADVAATDPALNEGAAPVQQAEAPAAAESQPVEAAQAEAAPPAVSAPAPANDGNPPPGGGDLPF